MGRPQDKYPDEWARMLGRNSELRAVLRGLIAECENADHWIRHTDAFEKVKLTLMEEDRTDKR